MWYMCDKKMVFFVVTYLYFLCCVGALKILVLIYDSMLLLLWIEWNFRKRQKVSRRILLLNMLPWFSLITVVRRTYLLIFFNSRRKFSFLWGSKACMTFLFLGERRSIFYCNFFKEKGYKKVMRFIMQVLTYMPEKGTFASVSIIIINTLLSLFLLLLSCNMVLPQKGLAMFGK